MDITIKSGSTGDKNYIAVFSNYVHMSVSDVSVFKRFKETDGVYSITYALF